MSHNGCLYGHTNINSLAPGKCCCNFKSVIFKVISMIDIWSTSCEIALWWMSKHLTNDQSTLVQVMAWCHQATSHYLSQCWPIYMTPYCVPRPQWVNMSSHIPPNYKVTDKGIAYEKIISDIKSNAWVTVNNDFWVTSEAICQLFSRVTKSRVKIIGESHHGWPKNRYSR